ncbi:MAG TPA: hypothetical protein VMT34_15845 [Aggregatilineales bacterium]|nr:hypothetical protein [Aggregatilineales bacterium]
MNLQDFKTRVLRPLLDDAPVASSDPVYLFAAELDQPERFVFESDRWDDVIGASRQIARAGERITAVLAADGFTPDDALHLDSTGFLVLVHDPDLLPRWTESLTRAVAEETSVVTLSTAVLRLAASQLHGGLYRNPAAVLGVPGVNDYQERINRYYGIDQASSIPRGEAVAKRRHFGEALAVLRGRLRRAQETPSLTPFYDALAFARRCASCQRRPAERLDAGAEPICGVCWRKRKAGSDISSADRGLVWIEAIGLERVLEDQRTIGAYQRLSRDIDENLRVVASGDVLLSGGGHIRFVVEKALQAATKALEEIRTQYENHAPAPFVAVVITRGSPGEMATLAQMAIQNLYRSPEGFLIDVREAGTAFDRFRKPLTLDEARRRSMP